MWCLLYVSLFVVAVMCFRFVVCWSLVVVGLFVIGVRCLLLVAGSSLMGAVWCLLLCTVCCLWLLASVVVCG